MSQHEPARPLFGNFLPPQFNDRISLWSAQNVSDAFTGFEMSLLQTAALAYADPRRPSIRELHDLLLEMIDRHDRFTGRTMRRPTFTDVRDLVETLPADFITQQRFDRPLRARFISARVEAFMAEICEKRAAARN